MAKTIVDAIARVQAIVGGVTGIKHAPSFPPEQPNIFPIAFTVPAEGEITPEEATSNLGIKTITTIIATNRKDAEKDVEKILPFGDTVPAAILNDINLDRTIDTILSVSYSFGPIEYADLTLVGWIFSIRFKQKTDATR